MGDPKSQSAYTVKSPYYKVPISHVACIISVTSPDNPGALCLFIFFSAALTSSLSCFHHYTFHLLPVIIYTQTFPFCFLYLTSDPTSIVLTFCEMLDILNVSWLTFYCCTCYNVKNLFYLRMKYSISKCIFWYSANKKYTLQNTKWIVPFYVALWHFFHTQLLYRFSINVCIDRCLQCFDAVGWLAGRASGL